MIDLQADVFIAGSGPLGATFARAFTAAGKSVLMIDAGAQLSQRPGAHLKNSFLYQRDINKFTPIVQGLLQPISTPSGAPRGTPLDPTSFQVRGIRSSQNPMQDASRNLPGAAVSYGVGGMFSHWTNNTPRHHPALERWPRLEAARWDVLYSAAEKLLHTNTDVFSGSVRHSVIKDVLNAHYEGELEEGYKIDDLPTAGERRTDNDEFVHFTGVDTVLGPLIDEDGRITNSQFRLLPEHRLTELIRSPGGEISHARVDDLKRWESVRVEAELYVVACGSLLTPQILWNSGIRPPALGRYLTEHPMSFTQVVLRDSVVHSIAQRVPPDELDPSDPVPIPMHDPPPMLRVPVCQGRPWHGQVHRDSFSFGGLPPNVDDRLVVDLRWFGMVEPQYDNRVYFLEGLKDKFGMPKPTFEFGLSDNDKDSCHRMMSDMVEAALELGGFLPDAEPRFMPLGTSLHFMGTYRAGEEEETSVVDEYSQVWGVPNLLLGGNGVIPTSTACNPTLTSVAFALHSATKFTNLTLDEITG